MMQSNGTIEKNKGIMALKAIMCLFVVIIHVPMWGRNIYEPILLVAVPCFYIISGFYLYKGDYVREIATAWRYLKKILLLSVCLHLFYFFAISISREEPINWDLRSLFIQRSAIYSHLWYLTAAWQSFLIFIIVRRFCRKIIYIFPILAIGNLLLGRYCFLFNEIEYPISYSLNALTTGLPYISVGYIIAKCKLNKLYYLSSLLIPISVTFAYIENYILTIYDKNNGAHYQISTFFLAAFLFISSSSLQKIPKWIINVGEKHSANVYYYHPLIYVLCLRLFTNSFMGETLYKVIALIVFFTCIVFSYIINLLSRYLRGLWKI